ncbi:MAG: OsmC family protein [Acidimicrobiia bacterium]
MRADIIERTAEVWTEAPDRARSAPTVVATSEESQAIIEAGAFTWRTDLPEGLGGSNAAASPTALLLGALAGCAVVFVRDVLGPQLGIGVDAVSAKVSCETDARGLLGFEGVVQHLEAMRVEVEVSSPDGHDAVAKIAQVWKERCPIFLALTKPTPVDVVFRNA